MVILNIIINIFFIYLTFYAVYLFTLNVKLFSSKKYIKNLKEEQNLLSDYDSKLCVIVWGKDRTIRNLDILNSLNTQTYKHENYEVHLINAYTNKNHPKLPDFMAGARIYNIENKEFFSRDKATSVFIEKLLQEKTFDAFVFLDADRIIDANYLETISKNLKDNEVLTGRLDVEIDNSGFLRYLTSSILEIKQKYKNITFHLARLMFDLPTIIDGNNVVIKTETLERIGRVCFETKNDELKYSLFLTSNKIKPMYSPFIKTRISQDNYNITSTNIFQRLSLFKYYFPLLIKKPFYFVEFVFLLLKPNAVLATLLYLSLFYFTARYALYLNGFREILCLGAFFAFNIICGLVVSKISFTESLLLPLYPFYSMILKYKNFAKKITIKNIKEQIKDDENVNSATIKAFVTNGQKSLICKLDLVSEDGMRKVVFRYNRKKLFSDSFIRMYDAIYNISRKLENKGYVLKICENCRYFQPVQDESHDLLKGECSARIKANGERDKMLIWHGCMNFKHRDENIILDED